MCLHAYVCIACVYACVTAMLKKKKRDKAGPRECVWKAENLQEDLATHAFVLLGKFQDSTLHFAEMKSCFDFALSSAG